MSDETRPRLAAVDDAGYRAGVRARARRHQQRLDAGEVARPFRVGLIGTYTLQPLVPFVVDGLVNLGVEPRLELAGVGELMPILLDPGGRFVAGLDAVVVLWRYDDLAGPELAAAGDGDGTAIDRAGDRLRELAGALAALRARFAGTIVVAVPSSPASTIVNTLGGLVAGATLATLRSAWTSVVAGVAGVRLLDIDTLERHYGAGRAGDPRTAYLYRQPYREGFLALVGEKLATALAATIVAPRKCIALDCDGTLWGGIVGEDGPHGVEVGDDFPGAAFRDFQQLLARWRRRGILLTMLSRNNEADVLEVFDARPDLPLRRDDFAAWQINWEPKPANLIRLAMTLNLGLESFVFVDDSPREVEEMRAALPQVRSILVPDDPADLVAELLRHDLFETGPTTAEDRQRTALMATEARRAADLAEVTHDDFLAGLGLQVRVAPAGEAELARVFQLVSKTNQFNLTTRRRSADELRTIMQDDRTRLLALWAADKYGDYGLTGVAIVRGDDPAAIDTFLLSCRVLGRGVEAAFMAAVAAHARAAGARTLHAEFLPTAKNAPAAGFLASSGFVQREDGAWIADVVAITPAPAHVVLI